MTEVRQKLDEIMSSVVHASCVPSPLLAARADKGARETGRDRLPGLSGIRSVSDNGLQMGFCWR
jgi:hypothetical protein